MVVKVESLIIIFGQSLCHIYKRYFLYVSSYGISKNSGFKDVNNYNNKENCDSCAFLAAVFESYMLVY